MYKVTFDEYEPSPDSAPGIIRTVIRYMTAKELEEFSKTHEDFNVETIRWEPSRED